VKILLLIISLYFLTGYSYSQRTVFPDLNWKGSTPEEQGVNSEKLDEAMHYLGNFTGSKQKSKQALVIRNGHLIWDGGATADSLDCVFSVTKSFASTVLGHLIDNGKCSLESLAKDYVSLNLSQYPDVNLFHLSTMTSGYNSQGPTWIKNGISTPFKPIDPNFVPGEYVEYNDHAAHLYGYVLTQIIANNKANLDSYFRQNIAGKIGIQDDQWFWDTGWPRCKVDNTNPDYADVRSAATGLWISARALAKFGYLFLNNGRWKEEQVISEKWVKMATSVQVPASMPVFGNYGASKTAPGRQGFLWWINKKGGPYHRLLWENAPEDTYAAVGAHNNWCWIIPEWNMVVVRIGSDNPKYVGNFDKRYDTFFLKLSEAIIDKK
jgi:CubicO group peptidase (beta-lactamase class C family)